MITVQEAPQHGSGQGQMHEDVRRAERDGALWLRYCEMAAVPGYRARVPGSIPVAIRFFDK
jgi:hypothetical protein